MSQWYVSKNGKALGPFSESEMIEKIKNHELNHLDLVYKTGLSEWQTLNEMDELKEYFQTDKTVPKKDKSIVSEWVVLKKAKSEKGSEYKQLGPFTEDQVLELIDQGEVRFSDFGWKKGLETWVKISQLEPFSKPLPSSSQVDHSLYEKTSPDLNVETLTDHEKRSLTNMVKIERFDHNLDKETQVSGAPSLSDEFATQTDLHLKMSSVSGTDDKVNLWSLEPPEQNSLSDDEMDLDKTVVASGKTTLLKHKVKEPVRQNKEVTKDVKSAPKKAKKRKEHKEEFQLSGEVKQWILACGVFVIAASFLYMSLSPSNPEIAYEEPAKQTVFSQNDEVDSADARKSEIYQKMEKLKENIKEVQNLPAVEKPRVEVKVSPKVPLEQKINIKKVRVLTKVVKPAEKAKNDKVVQDTTTKIVEKPVAIKIKKVEKKNTVDNLAKGSLKSKSYYIQRDRKALFYSSLKAETLAVDIQRQFSKLKKNKSAWQKFYSAWKRKVQVSLASDIRNYPVRSEKYAYPKIIENFKKDYELFYKYGEAFNAKVNGAREPSGAPRDMQNLFTRYKKQAQGLEQN